MGTPYPSYGPPKLVESRGIEEIPPRTPLTLERQKPQNRAPLLTDSGGELLTVYFGTPNMFITLWFGFVYGTNPPLGTLII
jgi:hypothetical protein